jgi:hypothetical protein
MKSILAVDVLIGQSPQIVHHRGPCVWTREVTNTGEDMAHPIGGHGFNPIHSFSRYDQFR